jgi:hypothetical protein
MRIRYEAPLGSAVSSSSNLALLTLARLVSAGQLPATTRASDPLSAAVLSNFKAQHPDKPVPRDVGELMLAFAGDADGDGLLDLDLTGVAETGLFVLDAAAVEQATQASFTQDQFVAIEGGAPSLKDASPEALGWGQQSIYDEVDTSTAAVDGLVHYVRSMQGDALTIDLPLSLDAKGALLKGAGDPATGRHFEHASLAFQGQTLTLSLQGASDRADFTVSSAGALKDQSGTVVVDQAQARWLLTELLRATPEGKADTHFAAVDGLFQKQAALDASTTAPTDPAERAIWAAGHVTPDDLQKRITTLTDAWGIRPLRWQGWVNDASEVNTARAVLDATAGQTAIRPSYLYTIAIGEGLLYYLNQNNQFTTVDTSQPVNGFQSLGTDTFATAAPDLKRRGLLPAWFTQGRDYTVETNTNELNQAVSSANYPDLRRGLIALRAMLADSRGRFLADAKTILGPDKAAKLTQDQIDYFTYVYFNAGAGFGKKHLLASGLGAVSKWQGPPPAGNTIARYNSLQRLSTLKLIDGMQLFPAKSPGLPFTPPAS